MVAGRCYTPGAPPPGVLQGVVHGRSRRRLCAGAHPVKGCIPLTLASGKAPAPASRPLQQKRSAAGSRSLAAPAPPPLQRPPLDAGAREAAQAALGWTSPRQWPCRLQVSAPLLAPVAAQQLLGFAPVSCLSPGPLPVHAPAGGQVYTDSPNSKPAGFGIQDFQGACIVCVAACDWCLRVISRKIS